MVHFKDVQAIFGVWVTVSEGVEARAENDVLANSAPDCKVEFVFGISGAQGNDGSKPALDRGLRREFQIRV
jgi:hypothetical protein